MLVSANPATFSIILSNSKTCLDFCFIVIPPNGHSFNAYSQRLSQYGDIPLMPARKDYPFIKGVSPFLCRCVALIWGHSSYSKDLPYRKRCVPFPLKYILQIMTSCKFVFFQNIRCFNPVYFTVQCVNYFFCIVQIRCIY